LTIIPVIIFWQDDDRVCDTDRERVKLGILTPWLCEIMRSHILYWHCDCGIMRFNILYSLCDGMEYWLVTNLWKLINRYPWRSLKTEVLQMTYDKFAECFDIRIHIYVYVWYLKCCFYLCFLMCCSVDFILFIEYIYFLFKYE